MGYVSQALFDGPIDQRAYNYHPVILDRLPSLDNGDVQILPVTVQTGDTIWDGHKQRMLSEGWNQKVETCSRQVIEFTGEPICMLQMSVVYRLRRDVLWSDGTPLTARDAILGYKMALAANPNVWATQSYEALDDYTVRWTGWPGYTDLNYHYPGIFYLPFPQHVWGPDAWKKASVLSESEVDPLGWGPFVLDEWVKGEYIHLVRNPFYFRADEGLPHLDEVTFRFIESSDQVLEAVVEGGCDIVPDTGDYEELRADLSALMDAESQGLYNVAYLRGKPLWLEFGIDTYRNRPDWFSDVRVRRAFAYCIDRQSIADETFHRQSTVWDVYLPFDHPLYAGKELTVYHYDPQKGNRLLDELGWTDRDGDGIRENEAGEPFSVTLGFGTSFEQPIVEAIQQDLRNCGVNVQRQSGVSLLDLYNRQFDLALTVGAAVPEACRIFMSSSIPTEEDLWAGRNVSGYTNPAFDAACGQALAAWPGTEDYINGHRRAQVIFSQELPALPLFHIVNVALARPEVKGFNPYLADNELWNIEEIDISVEQ